MNETTGNARTKPMKKPKSPGIPENFERELLKEREMNSLSDSEKTNEIKINNNQEKADCQLCIFSHNLAYELGNPSCFPAIYGCWKNIKFKIPNNPKKCNKFTKKGGLRL